MIKRLRQICQQDQRLVAAMLYGSFTYGEGDQYSDVECTLFFQDNALAEIDQVAWISQIAPVELYFFNEWGTGVAVFEDLVRGEFHFHAVSDMTMVEGWKGNAWFPSLEAVLLVDRNGELTRRLQDLIGPPPARDAPENVQQFANCFINWTLFGFNVLQRGELARALDILGWMQRYLLWMARLQERTVVHWHTPARLLESDISPSAYTRFATCTARLDRAELGQAYLAAWDWGKELMRSLAQQHDISVSDSLIDKLDAQTCQV
jgi:lincosamide nucleotidyltransferase